METRFHVHFFCFVQYLQVGGVDVENEQAEQSECEE